MLYLIFAIIFVLYLTVEDWVNHSTNIQWLKERRKEYDKEDIG